MDSAENPPPKRISWTLPVALAAVLAVVAAMRMGRDEAPPPVGDPAAGPVVTLDQTGGSQGDTSVDLPWREGLTVLEATQRAGERDPAAWGSRWRGEREMAFLERMAGEENQGAEGLNWLFEVNGELAERGAGATPLEAGDRVLWKLAPYE